jgi:phosphosulfolactate synthase (CoM biosynthesis protein A)
MRGVRACNIEDLKKLLIAAYGGNVNLANVAPDALIDLEASAWDWASRVRQSRM